ncbi:MAG: ABC transporter permease, partial [Candidatus Devosia euplotis]|nr:ABC transporter permease [Candidatus Devosia euplotis]
MRRLLAHPSLTIGLSAAVLFALLGLVSLVWTPLPIDDIDIGRRFVGVTPNHWLGTDKLGRDMASLLMAGTLTSFIVATLAVVIGMGIGVSLHLLAAARSGPGQLVVVGFSGLVLPSSHGNVGLLVAPRGGPGATNA